MGRQKVVLITGCSTGIGWELSKVLSAIGYTVVATARNVAALNDLPVSLRLPLDVTDQETINAAVNKVLDRFNRIDILVNNAGYSIRGALEEVGVEDVEKMFAVNVFGIIDMVQAVVPIMRRQGGGKIINIGSISGKFVQPVNGAYCASKFAVEALSDALRFELANDNIQVTIIEPGPVKTNFFKTMLENSSVLMSNPNSNYLRFYQSEAKMRDRQKQADPREVAKAISNVILKRRLRNRYQIAVPLAYSIITYLPDWLKEYILKSKFRDGS